MHIHPKTPYHKPLTGIKSLLWQVPIKYTEHQISANSSVLPSITFVPVFLLATMNRFLFYIKLKKIGRIICLKLGKPSRIIAPPLLWV